MSITISVLTMRKIIKVITGQLCTYANRVSTTEFCGGQ